MKIRISPLILIIIFITISIVFYKGLQNSNIYKPNVNIEKIIPSFEAKIFDSSYKIKSKEIFKDDNFYLLNVWASWCVPCKNEHPFLMNLSKKKNLEIIGLNYKDNEINAKKFLSELNNPYKIIILDTDGTISIEWGAYGVPETFLVKNGKIIKKIIGPIDKISFLELEKKIQ